MVKTESEVKEIIHTYVNELNRLIRVERVILFGSYAQGEPLITSDIDLVVISKSFKDMDFADRLFFLLKHWQAHIGADILGYTPEEFDRFSKGITLLAEIKKNGKVVWG